MFRAARNKLALVQDIYSEAERCISWHIDFRRNLRSFEVESLNDLQAQLGEFPLDLDGNDEMVWTGDP